MHQSNDVDNAMNDIIMVVDHQQKRRLFLYDLRSGYFYIQFLLALQAGYDRYIRHAPSLYVFIYSYTGKIYYVQYTL